MNSSNITSKKTKKNWSKYTRVFASLCLLAIAFPVSEITFSSNKVYAQQVENGVLSIEILDSKGSPLSGAVIKVFTVINNSDQQVGEKVTDAKGLVQFPGLAQAKYRLEITADNHEPYVEDNVEIVGGMMGRASIQLSEKLSPVGIEVEVKAESDNPIEKLDQPAGELKLQQIKMIPALSRDFDATLGTIPNVIRPPDGKVSIKGSRENQSALLINGADGSDPATGDFTKNIPLESIGQIKVYTNPYLPEYGRFTGGVTKVETRRGGDKFKFDFTDFFPEPRFRGGQLFGFSNVSPRLHLEGPIVKNRAYFSQGLEVSIDKKPVRGLASPINEIKRQVFRSFTQLDFILNPQHTLTTTVNFSTKRLQHIGLDFFNPQVVSPNQNGNDFTIGLVDRITLSNNSLLETLFQYKRINSEVAGKGNDLMIFSPLRRDGNYFHRENRITERYQFAITNTFAPQQTGSGTHNVKIGVDLNYLGSDSDITDNNVNIVRLDGTKTQTIQYFTLGAVRSANAQVAAFAQDQWLIKRNFSFDYGLRVEAQRAAATINVMPRLAMAYSPGNSGNTVLKAAAGLFYDKLPLNILSFRDRPQQLITNFAADGQTVVGSPTLFLNLLGPTPNSKVNTGSEFSAPRNLTFNLEVNQKITPNTLLKVAYLQSRTDNDFFVSPTQENGVNAIKLFNNGRNRYRSLEITTNFKLPKENSFSFSYIRSRATGELNDFNTYYGDFPDPILRPNEFGRLPIDAPNRILANGTFKLPLRFTVSPLLDIHTGFPYSIRDEAQNFVGPRNSVRFPRFASLDMAISKDIKVRDKYDAQFTLSLFNVTNPFNPRNIKANQADPGFGTFFASYRRFYRLDFAFMW